jgi:hypothetical protein
LSEKSCVSIIRLNFANTSASVMATVMGMSAGIGTLV